MTMVQIRFLSLLLYIALSLRPFLILAFSSRPHLILVVLLRSLFFFFTILPEPLFCALLFRSFLFLVVFSHSPLLLALLSGSCVLPVLLVAPWRRLLLLLLLLHSCPQADPPAALPPSPTWPGRFRPPVPVFGAPWTRSSSFSSFVSCHSGSSLSLLIGSFCSSSCSSFCHCHCTSSPRRKNSAPLLPGPWH